MLPKYSHTKSESLAQISTPMAEIHNFSRGLFLLAHPVYASGARYLSRYETAAEISEYIHGRVR